MSDAKAKLQAAITELGITVDATFVPWSKSRNFKPNGKLSNRSLNWRVSLKRNGREILTIDYSSGIGHAPSYSTGRLSMDQELALIHETEKGTAARSFRNPRAFYAVGQAIMPDVCDVVYSLVSDAQAIEHATFEDWASDYGYDVDSRKAEASYRACLEIGLKLRSALGESGLEMLRNACQDY